MRKGGLSCSGGTKKYYRYDLVFFYKAPERFLPLKKMRLAKEFIKILGLHSPRKRCRSFFIREQIQIPQLSAGLWSW
jgi:hypothetical protein